MTTPINAVEWCAAAGPPVALMASAPRVRSADLLVRIGHRRRRAPAGWSNLARPAGAAVLALAVLVSPSWAQVPVGRQLSYQGTLTNTAGDLVPDGSYQVTFRLYQAPTGGTAFFTESQAVTTLRGVFSALIGGATTGGIPAAAQLGFQVYLGISVGGSPELTPRTPLTPSPYALTAFTASALQVPLAQTASAASPLLSLSNSHASGIGLLGHHTATTGATPGVQGITESASADAVGVLGESRATAASSGSAGVLGKNAATGAGGSGVLGTHAGTGVGVAGLAAAGTGVSGTSATGTGVRGVSTSGAGVSATTSSGTGVSGSSSTGAGVSGSSTSGAGVSAVSSSGTGLLALSSTGTGLVATSTSGPAADFSVFSPTNDRSVLRVYTEGLGEAAQFRVNNATSGAFALVASTTGTGSAAGFTVSGASSPGAALVATTNGTGPVASFTATSPSRTMAALEVVSVGVGAAASFTVNNASGTQAAILASTNATGPAVRGWRTSTSGTEPGVRGLSSSTAVNASGVLGEILSTAPGAFAAGVRGVNNGTSGAGVGVFGSHAGSGWGVYGASTSGSGGWFTSAGGTTLVANHTGTSGDLAGFRVNNANVARIDRTGRGFFNGGTQASGADLAESFDVEGDRDAYEPGDVLVISRRSDRAMERSTEAHSSRVAGVHATKPGVLLSNLDIEADHSHRVPVGVVGVIPTKVSAENGPIRRGDLLVTAATAGHAMRAGASPAVGSVLGKALQDFAGPGTGVIDVLVNVK